jgi:S-DNA-T family DNA segregation ATPase FtsK/SpoIIIE
VRRWINGYRCTREERWAQHELQESLRWAFREACIGCGVAIAVDAPVAGTGFRTPEVTNIDLGPPTRFTVRMLPGQVPTQLQRAGLLIAPHLGGVALRVEDRGLGWAIVTVLDVDPLTGVLPLQLPRIQTGLLIGRDEGGQEILADPIDWPHTICQGVTRSGKSVWTYGLLAQLADCPDVLVAGLDPTGLLWRPFADTRHAEWHVSGLRDLPAHEKLLTRITDEMDARIADLPIDRDTIEITEDRPLLFVVLEEYPGLLRVLDAKKARGDDPGARVRALVSRLLAEGAKVGIRVVILAQRAEAAVLGAFERAMCSLRLSFRCDNRASVELLHAGSDPAIADAHTSALPGIALLSMPGRPLTRFRAPYIGGYREYAAAVIAASARLRRDGQ